MSFDPRAAEDLVRRTLGAFADRQFDIVRATLADDVLFETPFPYSLREPIVGGDAVTAFFAGATDPETGFFSALRFVDVDPHAYEDGRGLVCEYRSQGVLREGGHRYANHYVGLFELADGLIVRWREFANPDRVREALAASNGTAT